VLIHAMARATWSRPTFETQMILESDAGLRDGLTGLNSRSMVAGHMYYLARCVRPPRPAGVRIRSSFYRAGAEQTAPPRLICLGA